jgi:ParB family chromosome partitioning protein
MNEAVKIDIDKIVIRERSRDVDTDWAKALAASFRETEMLNPITLWRDGEEAVLVAGLHRIEAHLINGETEIECRWSQAATLADAKILETSENLLRHELTALDRAQHLTEFKIHYETKFPQTKHGAQGGAGAQKNETGILSFSLDVAEKTGMSERHIQRAVKMWNGLSFATIGIAKGTWLADHQAGLTQLSELKPHEQAKVLAMIFPNEGKQAKATNVADAIHILNNGRLATAVEKRFSGLNKAIKSLADEELNALLEANADRIAAWFRTHEGTL